MSSPGIDPRAARSRTRVFDAALELLRESGVAGCTIEAVAARSGVAKTTIYRQFRDREDLVAALIEDRKPQLVAGDRDGVLADVEHFLAALADGLQRGEMGCMVSTLIDLAERSPRGEQLAAEFGARRRRELTARLELAIARRELCDDVDVDVLVSQLVGPLFYRRLIARQPISRSFVHRSVVALLSPLLSTELATGRVDGPAPGRSGGRGRSARVAG